MAARARASPHVGIMLRSQTSGRFLKPVRLTLRAAGYWDLVESDIEARLKRAVEIRPPLEVYQPMHHLVFSAPKNLASALCVAACEAVGGQRGDAVTAAAALHLMHVAAITHENLLVLPEKHAHSSYDSNIQLLTADALIPLGFEMLAGQESGLGCGCDDVAGRVVRVIVEITRAIGSQGVVHRQYNEYVSRHERAEEGKFCACGAACGAILGGGDDEEVEKLRRCGRYMGMMNETSSYGDLIASGNEKAELRNLALKELSGFDEMKIERISCLLDSYASGQISMDLESVCSG
uniref:Uncharacterized protein n=1 Tax=Kalanchoe fedtschenkoi TaxID=63787 RepID=A0A7N0ZWR1_KALFE